MRKLPCIGLSITIWLCPYCLGNTAKSLSLQARPTVAWATNEDQRQKEEDDLGGSKQQPTKTKGKDKSGGKDGGKSSDKAGKK